MIDLASNGDERAFELLYSKHVGIVYSLSLRMLGNVSAAEDATQEIFARAWSKLSTFKGRSSFKTWIYRVAFNVILRQRYRSSTRVTVPYDDEQLAGTTDEDSIALRVDIERAVSTLPAKCRAVLVMHDIFGHTHQEITEVLRISPGTSKAHLHRARRILRKELDR